MLCSQTTGVVLVTCVTIEANSCCDRNWTRTRCPIVRGFRGHISRAAPAASCGCVLGGRLSSSQGRCNAAQGHTPWSSVALRNMNAAVAYLRRHKI